MTNAPVYLDYNATAPARPEVIDIVCEVMHQPGNASSVHQFGQRARGYVETARKQVADLINVEPNQIVFTSGATESNNTALHAFRDKRVLVSAIEHPAVMQSVPDAQRIPVTKDGVVNLDALESMLSEGKTPAIVSVMLVNSETGAIQPVKEIAMLAKEKGALVHTDAVQAAGRFDLNFQELGVDFMSLSAHKMAGPQGVGAFIFRSGLTFEKFMRGGTQERMQRGGTLNVPGIAGFGMAANIAKDQIRHYKTLSQWRDDMEEKLLSICPEAIICAKNAPRVGNTTSISLPGVPAQTQLMALDLAGVTVSSGSACSSGSFKSSHVLEAMGFGAESTSSALRISTGWATTQNDIKRFIDAWSDMAGRQKK